jgi:hypothetical protein
VPLSGTLFAVKEWAKFFGRNVDERLPIDRSQRTLIEFRVNRYRERLPRPIFQRPPQFNVAPFAADRGEAEPLKNANYLRAGETLKSWH